MISKGVKTPEKHRRRSVHTVDCGEQSCRRTDQSRILAEPMDCRRLSRKAKAVAVRLSGSSPRQQIEHENVELHQSMDRALPVSCNG